jgi:hypothetical protein
VIKGFFKPAAEVRSPTYCFEVIGIESIELYNISSFVKYIKDDKSAEVSISPTRCEAVLNTGCFAKNSKSPSDL